MTYGWDDEKSPAVERWFEDKTTELLAEKCNPDDPNNFIESLDNAHDDVMEELGRLLKEGDAHKLGQFLFSHAEEYWIGRAEQMAEDIWEEEAEKSRDYAACCYAAEHCVPGFL